MHDLQEEETRRYNRSRVFNRTIDKMEKEKNVFGLSIYRAIKQKNITTDQLIEQAGIRSMSSFYSVLHRKMVPMPLVVQYVERLSEILELNPVVLLTQYWGLPEMAGATMWFTHLYSRLPEEYKLVAIQQMQVLARHVLGDEMLPDPPDAGGGQHDSDE